jgi:uncharacterized protein
MSVLLADLRRFAVVRSLFPPTTLKRAVHKLGFVQADPIRAPARAQDLTLRHRVKGYRAGDLELRYASLGIEEDTFVNYGFVPHSVFALMHPRADISHWSPGRRKKVQALLEFVRERGTVHPREVDAHFSHGMVTNYWGGSSTATTHLLEAMHYRSLLRVARREGGIRIYTTSIAGGVPSRPPSPTVSGASGQSAPRDRIDALIDVVVGTYAPLPGLSLSGLVSRLRYAVPQWQPELKIALRRARQRLSHVRVADVDWYWPAEEGLPESPPPETVRFLAPFDPVVWDRRRFELFWGWAYRFEAYTPAPQRRRGYYALPLLWRDRVIGWANVSVKHGELQTEVGYVSARPPRERAFSRELEAERDRLREFLNLRDPTA